MRQSPVSSIINGGGRNVNFMIMNRLQSIRLFSIKIWQEWLNNEHEVSQNKYHETIYYNLWALTI